MKWPLLAAALIVAADALWTRLGGADHLAFDNDFPRYGMTDAQSQKGFSNVPARVGPRVRQWCRDRPTKRLRRRHHETRSWGTV